MQCLRTYKVYLKVLSHFICFWYHFSTVGSTDLKNGGEVCPDMVVYFEPHSSFAEMHGWSRKHYAICVELFLANKSITQT